MRWLHFTSYAWILTFPQSSQTIASQYDIPGSTLKTGICYTIDMKGFTPGYLTWTITSENITSKDGEVMRFLHHEFRLDSASAKKFLKGSGEWYKSTLWIFHPSGSHPGWFKMRNHKFPDKYVTWSLIYSVPTQRDGTSHYVTLEKDRQEEDFLLKPVFAEKKDGVEYHQLTMRHFPHGKINWSKHTTTSHFIQNHHGTTKNDRMERYEKDGYFYNDTLFIFKTAEEENECFSRSGLSVKQLDGFYRSKVFITFSVISYFKAKELC